MNYYKYDILFQEIPDEISLGIYFTGCSLRCPGCHSPELWNPSNGSPFKTTFLEDLIEKYKGKISCVLFMGGEWEPKELTMWAHYARKKQLKTALYTGRELEELPPSLKAELNIIKTGPWRMELGGLNSPSTNQKIHYNREVSICL